MASSADDSAYSGQCTPPSVPMSTTESFRLRSYQAEMVAESLKSNIICVMDTGSGKTHIAIERTRLELEACSREKLVWFLAPTVTLCEQQYEAFRSTLPGYSVQILCGRDDVDHWTEKKLWDKILNNIRIVVSTHQVLLDALTHAFVDLSRLALLVFDEAHHCTKDHPARRIMRDFYMMPGMSNSARLPAILGLTASPVMKAKASLESLQQIEQNLCATARTPKLYRRELSRFVYLPELIKVTYPIQNSALPQPSLLSALNTLIDSYDLESDPYVVDLRRQQRQGHDISRELQKVYLTGKTFCSIEIRTLLTKATAMLEELGPSPAEWYIQQCINRYLQSSRDPGYLLPDWSYEERQHLSYALRLCQNAILKDCTMRLEGISRKVKLLVDLLIKMATTNPHFTGIVFVEQRVWIAALAELLSKHPHTKDLFKFATFVGTSQSSKRRSSVANSIEPPNQQTTLDDFRAGRINLILATSVLEEGIDVSGCHLVICFERPKNLKSFVQRRGRARMQESQYIIFLPEVGTGRSPENWQTLEEEMKAAYMDDMREVKDVDDEEELDDDRRYYRVASTGALLTLDNASQHLHHFCAILGSGPYLDTRPAFDFTQTSQGLIIAEVSLPLFVNPAVRTATGTKSWRTEKMARQDAAFEAYKKLHEAGLVNDNLLPVRQVAEEELVNFQIPNQPSLITASPTLNPWREIAQLNVNDNGAYNRTLLTVRTGIEKSLHMMLFTKIPTPMMRNLVLYWNEFRQYQVSMSPGGEVTLQDREVAKIKRVTFELIYSVYGTRMQHGRNDFLWMLLPCDQSGEVSEAQYSKWFNSYRSAQDLMQEHATDISEWGLVSLSGRKYVAAQILRRVNTENGLEERIVRATALPKRRDFLHPIIHGNGFSQPHTRFEELNASMCIVDSVPASYAVFALLFPSILAKLETGLVARTLMTTLLKPVNFDSTEHLSVIVQALSSSSIGENNDYQRLEFLGDCVLKFITSIHLMAKYPLWPEGHLTAIKGRIVCNGSLAKASLSAGLDRFMLMKRFTGYRWTPLYVADVLEAPEPDKEQRSSKTVADIVESLIGASYVVGGVKKAFACIEVLLPSEAWIASERANSILFESAPVDSPRTILKTPENVVGHTFKKKTLLIEALTHASYAGPHAFCSYERLEFLGDAVLDQIVSSRLFNHAPALSHNTMHGIRTAMVNAAFLAFRMIETTTSETIVNKVTLQEESHSRYLSQFIRFNHVSLRTAQEKALKLHAVSREQIIKALGEDKRFPWHLLGLTDAPKEFSDIVESVLGAMYVDTKGDLAACEAYVRHLGILDCLDRVLRDRVDCFHPKERLGVLAVDRKVAYISKKVERTDGVDEDPWRCHIEVQGQKIGGVVSGLKRLSAETMAAYKACIIMERQKGSVVTEDDDVFFDAEEEGGGVCLDS